MSSAESGRRRGVVSVALFLLLILASALLLRSAFCFSLIFHDGRAHFRTDDPYFHVHLAQNLVHHFPKPNVFDPFLHFWSGQEIVVGPLLDFLVAGVALLVGAGRPGSAPVEAVAAWMPAVLGSLTALPVFFLARRLWGPWAAYPAAVLIVLMPGQFLRRSLLGFADHHALEVLTVALFLWLAASVVGDGSVSWRRSIPAGLSLGAYLAAWSAADLLLAILAAWLIVEFVISIRADLPAFSAGIALARFLSVAALVALPWATIDHGCRRHLAICVSLAAVSLGLAALSPRLRHDGSSRRTGGLAVLAAAVVALAALPEIFPQVGDWLVKAFARLGEGSGNAMISEDAPLLATGRGLSPLFREFGLAWIAAVIGIGLSLAALGRRASTGERLLALWSAVMIVLTFRQNRFSYYLAVAVALYAGRAIGAAARSGIRGGRSAAIAAAGILGAVCLRPAVAVASHFSGPPADWEETLSFLKIVSPFPAGDSRAFERSYPATYGALPESLRPQYGVLAWWDYGYWVLGLAERVPVANPSQIGSDTVARWLLETDPATARRRLVKSRVRYVILDALLPVLPVHGPGSPLAGKFSAIASSAPRPLRQFIEFVGDSRGKRMTLFTADYFRTMLVRLYLFGGRSVEPTTPVWVAKFRHTAKGTEAEDLRSFETYSAALEFVRADPLRRLVSFDPTQPCVELGISEGFSEIHDSPTRLSEGGRTVGLVELFEVSVR